MIQLPGYIIKRVLYAILALSVFTALTFIMMRFLSGDPCKGKKTVSETARRKLEAKYGLDRPVWKQ